MKHDGRRARVFEVRECEIDAFADDPLVLGDRWSDQLRRQVQDVIRTKYCFEPLRGQFDPIAFDTRKGDFEQIALWFHAELGGQILENKEEAQRLAGQMLHVEAVIKMLDPTYNLRRISVKRRQPNPWFKRGTVYRRAVDALRAATEPMTAREIAGISLVSEGGPMNLGYTLVPIGCRVDQPELIGKPVRYGRVRGWISFSSHPKGAVARPFGVLLCASGAS
jgi:hypothetical protein